MPPSSSAALACWSTAGGPRSSSRAAKRRQLRGVALGLRPARQVRKTQVLHLRERGLPASLRLNEDERAEVRARERVVVDGETDGARHARGTPAARAAFG